MKYLYNVYLYNVVMPSIRMVKMNMVIVNSGSSASKSNIPSAAPVPSAFGKSKLYAPMVMRIAGTKGGCACGH